ncbi:MAG TPA: peptidase S16 [Hyphomonadaceae bacterium]|nr:peptidase S16 [Hyphomonadaceae bacterium]
MSGYQTIADLPKRLAVFPLGGALLFPRMQLPLNIFEPRYLNMIDDAMSGDRLIAMVQPLTDHENRTAPRLARVAGLGRITSYSETDDGRYLITLTGLCRARIVDELGLPKPYRTVSADYADYAADFAPDDGAETIDREGLLGALDRFVRRNGYQADWNAAQAAPMEMLVNALCAACPFALAEKQALLEAPDLAARADLLGRLLDLNSGGAAQGDSIQ